MASLISGGNNFPRFRGSAVEYALALSYGIVMAIALTSFMTFFSSKIFFQSGCRRVFFATACIVPSEKCVLPCPKRVLRSTLNRPHVAVHRLDYQGTALSKNAHDEYNPSENLLFFRNSLDYFLDDLSVFEFRNGYSTE